MKCPSDLLTFYAEILALVGIALLADFVPFELVPPHDTHTRLRRTA
ncbi:hypothetical protein [Longibacter salinarum]|nr:hypothetical protein [Longibacter salinarum]